MVAYHWHPYVQGSEFPHVHALAAAPEIQRLHIAVPCCTLKHVLTLAMRDLGVQPVRGDWQQAVAEADATLQATMSE